MPMLRRVRPPLPDWLRQVREERFMSREELGELFGVAPEEVAAWEEGRPVPDRLVAPLVRWLETGYPPDEGEALPADERYPWKVDTQPGS